MKHLEIHIIQSVPVSCLNRDDLNSPKTAMFGGVQRARVSSQSWKRAIRELAKELAEDCFQGQRTRLIYQPLYEAMLKEGLGEEEARKGAEEIVDLLVKLDDKGKKDKKGDEEPVVRSKTLYFMSPMELQKMAREYASQKDAKKTIKKVKPGMQLDAADISLFGRMVANDPSLNVEAASMFSHALSTHRADNEIDFFSAVDDLQSHDETGAGMTGTLEFNSATYYRFAALNLDMLADENHLKGLTQEERRRVVRTFVEAVIKAVPNARKATMNGNTLPVHVRIVVREKGHPVQLVNAFEKPVQGPGYAQRSVELLEQEYRRLKETWNLEAVFEGVIPEMTLAACLKEVEKHVP